ncbi:ribbon-helix-helix domain-containing protein [Caldinitratiruptor microaerophilus]|uniref:Antitoxin-like ribbon-helix-helix domain-containing protein n=1 Tax=Caldinitratiruptor microaerophilus TaxID=671077 RepID=A0AA35CPC7_9FIRM|nr:ribbon-helix-helix domain-containing protein [Caldinitratiruptor microaerophilus]BDG62338.1 hypothetical protein caldi_34280 [Caldinitratiruptor microaerophilus]
MAEVYKVDDEKWSKLIVRLPREWHRQLRILAAERETTLAAVVLEALEQVLREAGRLPKDESGPQTGR